MNTYMLSHSSNRSFLNDLLCAKYYCEFWGYSSAQQKLAIVWDLLWAKNSVIMMIIIIANTSSIYSIEDVSLSTLHALTHLILIVTLWQKFYYYPCLIGEDTEVQSS